MMTNSSPPRTLTVRSTAFPQQDGESQLTPVRLSGSEHVCELFSYELLLKTPEAIPGGVAVPGADIELNTLVGRELTLFIELDGKGQFTPGATGNEGDANQGAGTREISALISEAAYLRPEGRHHLYRLILRPWLHTATLTTDYKITQDKTVIELLDDLLADYPYPVEKRLDTGRYPLRDYQVQYGESDYAYFARLCEEWGISWWFEHHDEHHTLVLADQAGAWHKNPSKAYQDLHWYPEGHKVDEEYLHALQLSDRLVSGSVASTDTDYTRPRANLAVGRHNPRDTGSADQELYTWPIDSAQPQAGKMGLAGKANDPLDEGSQLTHIRHDAVRVNGMTADGAGHLRGMLAGHTFTLQKHPSAAANIEWRILQTTLLIEEVAEESQRKARQVDKADAVTVDAAAYHEPTHTDKTGQTWRCDLRLSVQATSETYRPPQHQMKPQASMVRATVTGPADKEMWTDALARVKVRFPWDRYHANDEKSSAWLRVASPWAGNHYGGIQIPRIGHEVIVDFENGDPDRPLVTGRVVNQTQLPPWQLPENQSLSGFRSKELYGEQANHLLFDDTEGAIQAQLSSDHALSQLNLGQITRVPDERGRQDSRGEGFELRTDAHGVIRAQAGLLLTTEGRPNAQKYIKDMAETSARLKTAQTLHEQMATLAEQHQAQEGEQQATIAQTLKAQQEAIKGASPPTEGQGAAPTQAASTPQNADNASHSAPQTFPEFAEPHLTLASPAGIETTTPGTTHMASGEHIALTAAENVGIAAGKGLFISVKNGIRLFVHKFGMRLLVGKNDISMKTLQNAIRFTAALEINERADKISLTATKEIKVVGGGSGTTWNAGGITEFTAGTHTVYAAAKSFAGPMSIPPGMKLTDPKKSHGCIPSLKQSAALQEGSMEIP